MSQPPDSTIAEPRPETGAVGGWPRFWLRLEAAAALSIAIGLYATGGHSWVLFLILFLAPDLTFAGYLAGPKIGAWCYNLAHSYVAPVVMLILLHLLDKSVAIPLIWIAHIGFDRILGYGLKYETGFGDTHLAKSGRK